MKYHLILLLTVCLSGCVSSDPREGGLLGGLYGLQTHAYDSRVQTRQEQLTALTEQQNQIQQSLRKAQARRLAQQQNITQLNHSQRQSEHEQQQLQASIQQLEKQLGELQAERKKYQQALATPTSLPSQQPDNKRLQALTRQTEILRKQIEELLR